MPIYTHADLTDHGLKIGLTAAGINLIKAEMYARKADRSNRLALPESLRLQYRDRALSEIELTHKLFREISGYTFFRPGIFREDSFVIVPGEHQIYAGIVHGILMRRERYNKHEDFPPVPNSIPLAYWYDSFYLERVSGFAANLLDNQFIYLLEANR